MLKTSHKIFLAKIVFHTLKFLRRLIGKGPFAQVKRHGVNWELDLREGIDFSIYLLGGFEPSSLKAYQSVIRRGDVVLDIGANIGSHTLPLARLVGAEGHVWAFEPTDFAFEKLTKNISLNPDLSKRITPLQIMLNDSSSKEPPAKLYSSWPLVDTGENLHPKHKGGLRTTKGARCVSLDHVLEEEGITSVRMVKLDVDGFEFPVLSGAKRMLSEMRPHFLMEWAPHVYAELGFDFADVINLLVGYGYSFKDPKTGKGLPASPDQINQMIPDGASINALAVPPPSSSSS